MTTLDIRNCSGKKRQIYHCMCIFPE